MQVVSTSKRFALMSRDMDIDAGEASTPEGMLRAGSKLFRHTLDVPTTGFEPASGAGCQTAWVPDSGSDFEVGWCVVRAAESHGQLA